MNTGIPMVDAIQRYKSLQVYRRPSSSCKVNEEWPHIVLSCYRKSEKELFYVKCLIMDRLTRVRLIILWNVWSCF